jgi:ketosteroid isomerase-like protein
MKRILLAAAVLIFAVFNIPSHAADADEQQALRQLKDTLAQAVSTQDFAAAQKVMHQPFMATVITQEHFTDLGALKSYFDGLYTRDFLRIKKMSIRPEVDGASQIFTGTIALNKGATTERYEMADGRSFDLKGRWTAVSVKESDGNWRLMGFHSGVNFLDNPVLSAIESSVLWTAAGAGVLGLLLGLVGGWLLKRRQVRA